MNPKSFLAFEKLPRTRDRKTDVVLVRNLEGCEIGVIKWYGPWRRYCFWNNGTTIFDAVCLNAITMELEQLCQARARERLIAKTGDAFVDAARSIGKALEKLPTKPKRL